MKVSVRQRIARVLGCVALLASSACSDVRHVVGKADLSATGGVGGIAASGSGGGGRGGSGGGFLGPPFGGGIPTVDASLPDVVDACTPIAVRAEPRRLNLYLVIDRTFAQAFAAAWESITRGVTLYARMPEAAGTGLGFDLIGIELAFTAPACSSPDYAMPFVPIGAEPLPSNADAIEAGLRNLPTAINSRLVPALNGAYTHVRSVRDSFQAHTAVVLFTDDIVDADCGSTVESAAAAAAAAYADKIPTYVIESDNPLDVVITPLTTILDPLLDVNFELDPIGTASATTVRRISIGQTNAQNVANMLLAIQRDAQPECQYAIPEGYAWEDLQLAIDDGSGPRPLPRLSDQSECGGSAGVYLDAESGHAYACTRTCKDLIRDSEPLWVESCESDAGVALMD